MSRSRRPPSPRRPSATPYRSITSQMTPVFDRAVVEAAEAELRGDAARALRLHRSVPMFVRSGHGADLALLAAWGDEAPAWLVSRWVGVQARRPMWRGGNESGIRSAVEWAVVAVYPDGVPFEALDATWTEQVGPLLAGRDWVVRQVGLYEQRGLRDFVQHHATPQLLARAEPVDGWLTARMGGYRFESTDGEVATLVHASTGRPIEVLDLGVGEGHAPGTHLLGRLVPTASAPGQLFEGPPLAVDEGTARVVARNPVGWLEVVGARVRTGRLRAGFSYRPEPLVSADLPRFAWLTLLGRDGDGRPEEPGDAAAALRSALPLARDREWVAARRHTLTTLLVEEDLSGRDVAAQARPEHVEAWRHLSEFVAEPARGRCREAALWSDAAGDSGPESLTG